MISKTLCPVFCVTFGLIFAHLFNVISSSSSEASLSDTTNFSLKALPVPDTLSLDGGMLVQLKVSNRGPSIEIATIEPTFVDVEFDAPKEWTPKKRNLRMDLLGRLPVSTLESGKEISTVVSLRDYFSTLTAGPAKITVRMKIWPDAGRAPKPIAISAIAEIVIKKP